MRETDVARCRDAGADLHVTPGPQRLVYPVDEVAIQLGGMDVRTVHRKIKNGEIPSFKIGGRRFVGHDELVAFVERCRAESRSDGE